MAKFSHLGYFDYSRVFGTPAAVLINHTIEAVKSEIAFIEEREAHYLTRVRETRHEIDLVKNDIREFPHDSFFRDNLRWWRDLYNERLAYLREYNTRKAFLMAALKAA